MVFIAVAVLIVLAMYIEAERLRLPALSAAYPTQPQDEFEKVGIFRVYRGYWSQGIATILANESGLKFRWLVPLKMQPIFIPWSDIWIGGNIDGAIKPKLRIEFDRLPDTQYEIRDTLIVRLDELFDGEVPL